ncbi:MAG: hypothetical protein ACLFV7_14555 [Phycisphaerae bacterium]
MARKCGTRAEPPIVPIASLAGFVMLAGLAVAIVAGVVLLPPYARLVRTCYQRDCLAAQVADETAALGAYDRMIAQAPTDPVLTQRLAMNQLGLAPRNARVERTAGGQLTTPGVVEVQPAARPQRPNGWMIRSARRLEQPSLRRGMLLLAGLSLLAGVVLFLLPDRRPGRNEA